MALELIKWLLSLSWNESSGAERIYAISCYDDSKALLPIDLKSLLTAATSAKEAALRNYLKTQKVTIMLESQ